MDFGESLNGKIFTVHTFRKNKYFFFEMMLVLTQKKVFAFVERVRKNVHVIVY